MADIALTTAALRAFTGKSFVSYDEYVRRCNLGKKDQCIAVDNNNLAAISYNIEQLEVNYFGSQTVARWHVCQVGEQKPVLHNSIADNANNFTYNMTPQRYVAVFPMKRQIVFVKGMDRKTSVIQLNKTDTIAELKRLYCRRINVYDNQFRLSFCGKPLMDTKLSDYGIGHESTVHVIPLLVGGGNPRFFVDPDLLDPQFDYDFTTLTKPPLMDITAEEVTYTTDHAAGCGMQSKLKINTVTTAGLAATPNPKTSGLFLTTGQMRRLPSSSPTLATTSRFRNAICTGREYTPRPSFLWPKIIP